MTTEKSGYYQQLKPICFYDGGCPICKIEINALKGLDKQRVIQWVDINNNTHELDTAGITYQQAMNEIHVLDDKQQIVTGIKGFLIIWKYLPYYRRLVPIIEKIPFLLPTLELAYQFFARYRLLITRKSQKGTKETKLLNTMFLNKGC